MGFRGPQAEPKTKMQSKKITTWRLQSCQNMQQLLIYYLGSRILGSSVLLLNLRVNFWREFIKPETLSSWVSLIPGLMLLALLQNCLVQCGAYKWPAIIKAKVLYIFTACCLKETY